jgi:predicted HAD superfamily Cof-like phosphohydrolase
MSDNWCKDINEMHTKFGVRDTVKNFDSVMLRTFLRFRLDFLQEELGETENAAETGKPIDAEEVVDGLIDLCVVAIGTLDALGVDPYKAWDEVHKANMSKEVGIKEGRNNPLNLPDLIKPTEATHGRDWIGPDHSDNHGDLAKI